MIDIFLIGFFLIVAVIFFLIYRNKKRKEFNNIKLGDKIYYTEDDYYECGNIINEGVISVIEYDYVGNITIIYTEEGNSFNFLDYVRDNFRLNRWS